VLWVLLDLVCDFTATVSASDGFVETAALSLLREVAQYSASSSETRRPRRPYLPCSCNVICVHAFASSNRVFLRGSLGVIGFESGRNLFRV
jgi:hypothetical protein